MQHRVKWANKIFKVQKSDLMGIGWWKNSSPHRNCICQSIQCYISFRNQPFDLHYKTNECFLHYMQHCTKINFTGDWVLGKFIFT